MFNSNDAIAAQATVPGEGGIGIIRISGDKSLQILEKLFVPFRNEKICPRKLTYGHIVCGNEVIDEVMAVFMRGPHTYTTEDMAEIQCHGSQYLIEEILALLMEQGCRIAEPGEFTYRAFINGRLDLSQSEAVMRIIGASNERARKSAFRQMDGEISHFAESLSERIMEISAGISALIDFPDEIDEEETSEMIVEKCSRIIREIEENCSARKGKLENDGIVVAICGKPNAGKSSLLNAIVGHERAIVTNIPGTTRDTISESMLIQGIRFTFIDTAGIRETEDIVERIGVDRAERAIQNADICLALIDSSEPAGHDLEDMLDRYHPDLLLISKEDISSHDVIADIERRAGGYEMLEISVKEMDKIEAVKNKLVSLAASFSGEQVFTQERHIACAQRAADYLRDAINCIAEELPVDMVNIDLTAAANALLEISGRNASEEVIGKVFENFCVGK